MIGRRKIKQGVRTERLLKALADYIKPHQAKLKGIMISQGGGSFSQTRLICAVANALAYAEGIKLAAVNSVIPVEHLRPVINKVSWQRLIKPAYRGPAVD